MAAVLVNPHDLGVAQRGAPPRLRAASTRARGLARATNARGQRDALRREDVVRVVHAVRTFGLGAALAKVLAAQCAHRLHLYLAIVLLRNSYARHALRVPPPTILQLTTRREQA